VHRLTQLLAPLRHDVRVSSRWLPRVVAPGAWRAAVHVTIGVPVGLLTPAVLLPGGVRTLTRLQRSRFRNLLDERIAAVPGGDAGVATAAWWRQVGYHLLSLPYHLAAALLVCGAGSAGLALALLPGYGWTLPRHSPITIVLLWLAGLLLLAGASHLARAAARLDTAVARLLLGPSRAEQLTARLDAVARGRTEAVAAADAERRRIERNLHDGAQQRLVSLALNLGMARAELGDAAGARAVAEAHDEAKQALVELRDLVRGLHPAVLDDRGLDAALSGIVARMPLPVDIHVDVPRRCPPAVEATAYFVVSEALTNVTRHARARQAAVTVVRAGDRLRVTVTDDGRGGAVAAPGGGLHGLAQRAASVDGTLHLHSPPGGPTEITVELPCGS
jgi:signal transduction histidine kinase